MITVKNSKTTKMQKKKEEKNLLLCQNPDIGTINVLMFPYCFYLLSTYKYRNTLFLKI